MGAQAGVEAADLVKPGNKRYLDKVNDSWASRKTQKLFLGDGGYRAPLIDGSLSLLTAYGSDKFHFTGQKPAVSAANVVLNFLPGALSSIHADYVCPETEAKGLNYFSGQFKKYSIQAGLESLYSQGLEAAFHHTSFNPSIDLFEVYATEPVVVLRILGSMYLQGRE
jgi:hypothetical protein